MKIILINVCARYGSTGSIVSILRQGYEELGHDAIVCYGSRKEKVIEPHYYKVTKPIESYLSALVYRLLGYQGVFLSCATSRVISIIEKEKPDVVQLLNIHGYYLDEFKLLSYLAESNIPTVYSMMDEYAYMGKCMFSFDCNKFIDGCHHCKRVSDYPKSMFFDRSSFYFRKKNNIYSIFNKIVFTGVPWVVSRALQSRLLKDKDVRKVNEPIDLDNYFLPQETDALREELNIPKENIIVLTVAVLSNPRKGGKFFLDMCRKMENKKGYSFVYVGYDTDEYEAPANIIKIPYVSSLTKLAQLFSLADVFVSTTLSDTIPNACIDSLGCGTPVCGFDISGLSFIGINDTNLVKLVKPFDLEALENGVMSFSKKTPSLIKRCRDAVYNDYSPKNVVNNYIDIFNNIVK